MSQHVSMQRTRRSWLVRLFCWLRDAWCVATIAGVLFLLVNAVFARFWTERMSTDVFERLRHATQLSEDSELHQLLRESVATQDTFDSSGVRWEPFVYWRNKPFVGKYITVGDNGIRKSWAAPESTRNAARISIFCFGGSTMWGCGARDEETIPSHIARCLSEQGVHADVTNFGQLGYVSTQEVITLFREIQRGQVPTVALFFDGINDIQSAGMNLAPGLAVREFMLAPAFDGFQDPSLRSLGELYVTRCPIARGFSHWAKNERVKARVKQYFEEHSPEEFAALVIDPYLANVRLGQALGEEFGFTCLFYWQPTVHSKALLSRHERQIAEREQNGKLFRFVNAQLESTLGGRSHDFGESARLVMIDHIFDDPAWGTQTAFYDPWHLTEAANQWIARRMCDDIMARLVPPPVFRSSDAKQFP